MSRDELIEKLKKLPNVEILIPGYEAGYNEINEITEATVIYNEKAPWWEGNYNRYTEGQLAIILQ